MTRAGTINQLTFVFLLYLLAAVAGPLIFATSQVVLERRHPTPVTTTPQKPSANTTFLSCAGLQDDTTRLRCYDSMSRK